MKGESTKFAIPIQKMRLANLQCDTQEITSKLQTNHSQC